MRAYHIEGNLLGVSKYASREDIMSEGIGYVLFAAVLLAFVIYGVSEFADEKRRERAEVKKAYDDALDYLAQHPTEPRARIECLERGRAFYLMTIPDTFTLVVGERTFGTQDYQNNTAGREARIAADIEARIGHLKLGPLKPGASTPS
jgi:Na+-transporting methylmalonyl-CoA/oxaloacetate decarboxylase gamma subunit